MSLIGIGVAGAAGLFGHVKSKNWVSRKLRYTSIVEKPATALGLASGGATAVAVGALGVLPFVAVPVLPAVIVGLGVGTGVAVGVKKARGE
ncbi:MAG: hypothetical protein F4087_09080 [Gemmatimonadetes bacterium]|nr:hypothetical protein [Gemmatimonadota bacterium]MXX35641.1 hypothetical protein [Gemmatimonadota bacterium]MYA11646.1 hypothetical protein [Gemmatimonadota bacterium]MYD12882.1 hypothetical protein [Gemmatimonadota bacterium]MYE71576.1 hypothetical protein [Gemmatimonadota bacterium]